MATVKKTNGNAPQAKGSVKGDNVAALLEASHVKMRDHGRAAKDGKGAKQRAIELFRDDCLAGIAGPHMVDTYVTWYDEGAKLSGGARKAFRSALAAFGDERVIAAYPDFSAALTKLHAAKDKRVSRTVTDKDKFAQLYGIANRIKNEGAPVKVTEDYIVATVAKASKSKEELAKLAKESLVDSVKTLIGEKPNAKLLEARNAFFKLLKVEVPA